MQNGATGRLTDQCGMDGPWARLRASQRPAWRRPATRCDCDRSGIGSRRVVVAWPSVRDGAAANICGRHYSLADDVDTMRPQDFGPHRCRSCPRLLPQASRDTGRALQGHRPRWSAVALNAGPCGSTHHPGPLPYRRRAVPGRPAGCPNAAKPEL